MVLAFLSLLSLNYVHAIKMKLYDRECFFKTAPEAGDRLYGSFVVQKGLAGTSKYFYSYIDLQASSFVNRDTRLVHSEYPLPAPSKNSSRIKFN